MAETYQSTNQIPINPLLNNKSDDVWRSGYVNLLSGDFTAVTGGHLAAKEVELFSYEVSDPDVFYWQRPHIEAYHYTKDGTDTIYDGVFFEATQMNFTVFENYNTGQVNRAGRAYLTQSYSLPVLTVKLKLEYFTKDATGATWAKDGNNWIFWIAYTTNIVQSLPPS